MTDMTDQATTIEALMSDYGWAMHHFQWLANSLSLLASSMESSEDLEAPSFHVDVDSVTNSSPLSASGQRIAALLTDQDRTTLRTLKQTREALLYRFFLEFDVEHPREQSAETVVAAAQERLSALKSEIAAAAAVLKRVITGLSEA